MNIHYKRLLDNPTEVGGEVLEFAGIPMSGDIEAGMEDWIEANRREHRAPHKYELEDFGLSKTGIRAEYSNYLEKFLFV